MLTAKSTNPKKTAILVVVSIIILGTIIYLVVDNFLTAEKGQIPSEWSKTFRSMSDVTLPEVPDLKSGSQMLQDPKYVGLKKIVDLPIMAGQTGRENPFLEIDFGPIAGVENGADNGENGAIANGGENNNNGCPPEITAQPNDYPVITGK